MKTIVQFLLTIFMLNCLGALAHSSLHEHVFCIEHQKLEESDHSTVDHSDSHKYFDSHNVSADDSRFVYENDHGDTSSRHTECFIDYSLKTEYLTQQLAHTPIRFPKWKLAILKPVDNSRDTLSIAPKASPPMLVIS